MVEKKRKEGRGAGNLAIEKARLIRERDYAQQTGDENVFAECAPTHIARGDES